MFLPLLKNEVKKGQTVLIVNDQQCDGLTQVFVPLLELLGAKPSKTTPRVVSCPSTKANFVTPKFCDDVDNGFNLRMRLS